MGDASRQRGSAAGTVVLMKHPASIRVRMPFATTAAHCCHFIICPPLTSALLTSITTTSSCLTTACFTSSHITAAHCYPLLLTATTSSSSRLSHPPASHICPPHINPHHIFLSNYCLLHIFSYHCCSQLPSCCFPPGRWSPLFRNTFCSVAAHIYPPRSFPV